MGTSRRVEPQLSPIGARGTGAAGQVAEVLARAFLPTPGYVAALGPIRADRRLALLTRIKRALVEVARADGHVEVARVDGKVAGALLHFPPGVWPLPMSRSVQVIRRALAPSLLPAAPRLLTILGWLERHHTTERHAYLQVIGVDPAWQGAGIGGALLRDFHARVDGWGTPAWLETDTEDNVRLYRRWGYEVVHDEVIHRAGGLRMWTMGRPAGAPR